MGDVNTDLTKDDGRDLPHFKKMLTDLNMTRAAQSKWKAAILHFKLTKATKCINRRTSTMFWCRREA